MRPSWAGPRTSASRPKRAAIRHAQGLRLEAECDGAAVRGGCGVTVTSLVFCILPFSHMVNKPSRTLELRKAGAVDLPPPTDPDTPPPPVEEEKAPEAPPPQLADAPQNIPLSADLDVAAGSGGALAGFGEVRSMTRPEATQQDAFDVADLEKRPEAVSQAAPAYPPELRKAKIEGVVTLVFVLSEEGRVEEPASRIPRARNSKSPPGSHPQMAVPSGMKDGRAVRTYIRIPMRFRVTAT